MTGVASGVPSDAGEKLGLMPVNSRQSVSNGEQCAYTNTRQQVSQIRAQQRGKDVL
jgi:hypothetical protein